VFYRTGAAWPRRAAPPCHHACSRGCSGHPPADPRAPLGAPRCGEHASAHPMAGDHTVGESRLTEVGRSAAWLTHGATTPGSCLSAPLRVWIWVNLAFFVGFLK